MRFERSDFSAFLTPVLRAAHMWSARPRQSRQKNAHGQNRGHVGYEKQVSHVLCTYKIPNKIKTRLRNYYASAHVRTHAEYLRVSVAEWFNADQHPNIIPGFELTLAPLHLVMVCQGAKSSQSHQDQGRALTLLNVAHYWFNTSGLGVCTIISHMRKLLQFTNVDISRELVDPSDGSCESPSWLVHSRPSEEGSFSWWLKAEWKKNVTNMFMPSGVICVLAVLHHPL